MQRVGIKITVVSTLAVNVCADNLRRQADKFIDLTDLRSYIERDGVHNYEEKKDVEIPTTVSASDIARGV